MLSQIIYGNVNSMAYGISSWLGILGVIFLVIGILMAIVGIILLIVNTNSSKPGYILAILIGGIVLAIIGGIMLAIALINATPDLPACDDVYRGAPVRYVEMQQPAAQVRYVQRPVQYAQQAQYAAPPPATQTVRQEAVGQATFDPDPQTYVFDNAQPAQRVVAEGPYGPGGTQARVTGTYKPQAVRNYVTSDVPEHPVNPAGTGYGVPVAQGQLQYVY